MAGKTLIDGAEYTITGGKTLIDGAVYSIQDGKTLIDGVVNTISFAVNKTVTITQNTSSYSSLAYIVVNGTTYNSTQTLNFPSGTIITAYARSTSSSFSARIIIDGVTVASGMGIQISYNYTLQTNCTIYFDKTSSRGRITITSV